MGTRGFHLQHGPVFITTTNMGVGHDAAKAGDLEALKDMDPDQLRQVSDHATRVTTHDGFYAACIIAETPAHVAARNGQLEVMQFLNKEVPDTLWVTGNDDRTPAHEAAQDGQLEVLNYLYEKVPDTLRATDNYGMTPAHRAAQNGRLEVLQYLYEKVPDTLRATDDDGDTPAHWAAHYKHLEVIQYLHEVVPDTLSATDNNGETPAEFVLYRLQGPHIVRVGHKAPQDVVDYLNKPWTPLMHAVVDKRPKDVKRILCQGVDPNESVVTHEGHTETIFSLASAQGDGDMMEVIERTLPPWSPETHPLYFTADFRRGVRHVLGLRLALNVMRQRDGHHHMLPAGVWLHVVMHLPRCWGLGEGTEVANLLEVDVQATLDEQTRKEGDKENRMNIMQRLHASP